MHTANSVLSLNNMYIRLLALLTLYDIRCACCASEAMNAAERYFVAHRYTTTLLRIQLSVKDIHIQNIFAILLPQVHPYVISIEVLKLLSEIIFYSIWQLTHF
jgi:hypothetical protein